MRVLFFLACLVCPLSAFTADQLGADLAQRLQKHVATLCAGEARNHNNLVALNAARDYIVKEFQKQGLPTELQTFEAGGNEYANVVARLQVGAEKTVVIGAHYDSCGEQPGADDNASAVAGLIELAAMLHGIHKQGQQTLQYNLEYVAYTLEEPPYFRTQQMGSYVHAQSLQAKLDDYAFMMCLEMIGYFTDEKNSQTYPAPGMDLLYPTTGNFIAVVGNMDSAALVNRVMKCMKKHADIPCEQLVAPAQLPGVDFSDHLNYWALGMKAVMITDTAFYRNKNYHTIGDSPETLNYKKMSEVVKGLVANFLE